MLASFVFFFSQFHLRTQYSAIWGRVGSASRQTDSPSFDIAKDTSLIGWEGFLDILLVQRTWKAEEAPLPNNILKLQTIWLSLQCWASWVDGSHNPVSVRQCYGSSILQPSGRKRMNCCSKRGRTVFGKNMFHPCQLFTSWRKTIGKQTTSAIRAWTQGNGPQPGSILEPMSRVGDARCELPGLHVHQTGKVCLQVHSSLVETMDAQWDQYNLIYAFPPVHVYSAGLRLGVFQGYAVALNWPRSKCSVGSTKYNSPRTDYLLVLQLLALKVRLKPLFWARGLWLLFPCYKKLGSLCTKKVYHHPWKANLAQCKEQSSCSRKYCPKSLFAVGSGSAFGPKYHRGVNHNLLILFQRLLASHSLVKTFAHVSFATPCDAIGFSLLSSAWG